jgi:hypothetical protein
VEPWWSLGGALVWLGGGFVLRSLCLVYAYNMALGWLWVASPRLKRSGVRDTSRKSENSVIMRMADNKVNDGGQPPMTFRLALRESAGSRSLHHPVCA